MIFEQFEKSEIKSILRSQKTKIMGDEHEKHYTLKINLFVKIAPRNFVSNISGHVMFSSENRSFHQDHPAVISCKNIRGHVANRNQFSPLKKTSLSVKSFLSFLNPSESCLGHVADRTQLSSLKIVTLCQIVPLIFEPPMNVVSTI